jgi:hypothetical protein
LFWKLLEKNGVNVHQPIYISAPIIIKSHSKPGKNLAGKKNTYFKGVRREEGGLRFLDQ